MTTTNKALNLPVYDTPNWDVPLNANFELIDKALGGGVQINVTGVSATPVTLTSTQYGNMAITFTGTLSNDVRYNVPSGVKGQWVIVNNTTGSFSLTVGSAAGGSTTVIQQSTVRSVYSDGAGVIFADTPSSVVGPSGQVVYNGASSLQSASNFTFNGTTLTVPNVSTTGGVAATGALSGATGNLATSLQIGLWLINETAGKLTISYNGSTILSISQTGAIVAEGDITAKGTV